MYPDKIPHGQGDDAKRPWCSTTPADPTSKVLGDDNLLIEIIIRLGFPTTLVRAALVCKRWFHCASDLAFLLRFRRLHPPRPLGFYINLLRDRHFSLFVPILPQPPELAAVIRRASFNLETYKTFVMDCWDGNVFVDLYNRETGSTYASHSPLFPGRGMRVVPQFPHHQVQDGNTCTFSKLLFRGEGNGLSYFYVWMESAKQGTKSTVHVYMLQDGVWCMQTSATTQLPCLPHKLNTLLVNNRIYMAATLSEILVLDLTALSFTTFQLPQGLVIGGKGTMLSRADDDSGVYLIHLNNELQLRVWLHTEDNWFLVDTICLHEMCAKLGMSDHTLELQIRQVGGNAEFVVLQMGRCLLYLDIKCRTLCKVYEMTSKDRCLGRIHPFMMIWPPTFPALG